MSNLLSDCRLALHEWKRNITIDKFILQHISSDDISNNEILLNAILLEDIVYSDGVVESYNKKSKDCYIYSLQNKDTIQDILDFASISITSLCDVYETINDVLKTNNICGVLTSELSAYEPNDDLCITIKSLKFNDFIVNKLVDDWVELSLDYNSTIDEQFSRIIVNFINVE